MASTHEIEVKLHIPEAALPALRKAVATATAHQVHLQALYIDTADGRLAAARMALRLRLEGGQWVQTLKAAGATDMARLEHNVRLDTPATEVPGIDPQRHAGTAVGEQLLALLAAGGEAATLQVRYRTDIHRCLRVVRRAGASIELALDEGEIVADGRRWAVSELELELLRGSPQALVDEAQRWVQRHGLWLDVRSKAERGERLARGELRARPVKARPLVLDAAASPDAARRAMLANALGHSLANAAEISAGTYGPEHVHQLRVALRRLRSGLRLFKGWGNDWDATPSAPQWEEQLATLFGQLGAARDRDALGAWLPAALAQAGAPLAALPAQGTPQADPVALLRSPQVTQLWLSLQCHALGQSLSEGSSGDDSTGPVDGPSGHLLPLCRKRLKRWYASLLAEAERYAAVDEAARHALRRRVKRLRYAVEFTAALWPAKRLRRFVDDLAPLQDALGHYSDVCAAQVLYRSATAQDPQAWFALGWLAREHDAALAEGARALKRFAKVAEPPWA